MGVHHGPVRHFGEKETKRCEWPGLERSIMKQIRSVVPSTLLWRSQKKMLLRDRELLSVLQSRICLFSMTSMYLQVKAESRILFIAIAKNWGEYVWEANSQSSQHGCTSTGNMCEHVSTAPEFQQVLCLTKSNLNNCQQHLKTVVLVPQDAWKNPQLH